MLRVWPETTGQRLVLLPSTGLITTQEVLTVPELQATANGTPPGVIRTPMAEGCTQG